MESVKKKMYMDHMIQSTSHFVNVSWIQIWQFQIFPFFFLFPVAFPHGEKTEKGMPATSASKSAKNLHFISKLGNYSWNILHPDHYPLTHSKKKLKKWAVFHFWSQQISQTMLCVPLGALDFGLSDMPSCSHEGLRVKKLPH